MASSSNGVTSSRSVSSVEIDQPGQSVSGHRIGVVILPPSANEDAVSVMTATSPSLLVRVRQHEVRAWERLVELYSPLVQRWGMRGGLRDADLADLGQEVFLVVHQRIESFRREGERDSFRGWLYGITRHKVADQQRRRARRPVAEGGTDAQRRLEQEPASQLPDELTDAEHANDEALVVRRALELVRSEFQEPTWRACFEIAVQGRAASDVAADLGMSVGAVYVAKSRVLKRLREELADLA